MRAVFFIVAIASSALVVYFGFQHAWVWAFAPLVLLYIGTGIYDLTQTKHALLRNYPVIGHGRYIMELVRPEIQQYFVESNIGGRPFHRNDRSVVYQRSKGQIETMPFGTQYNVYEDGYEWMNHSLDPKPHLTEEPRVVVGEGRCERPYACSLFNISAMSYGSLSRRAVLALNKGASEEGFAHNTGEGGVSPYHLEYGGDLIYQIGTGYFGCRAADGGFSEERFLETVKSDSIKMIEVKLSQGAKPAHGGILPAAKVTSEIAKIRGVEEGVAVHSPPKHKAFDNPVELLTFIGRLRRLSGRPVGIKLCIGQPEEFVGLVRAMVECKQVPDYISLDGSEGGTGAAPFEFSNSVGMPLRDGLAFVHNCLVGAGLRDQIKVMASGKIISGFHMFRALALGADMCCSSRGMMFSLGCIQARRCNHNDCPVGVATNHPKLDKAIDVEDKGERVGRYHKRTVESFLELLGAAGLDDPDKIRPHHIYRRIDERTCTRYSELYEWLEPGDLLEDNAPEEFQRMWDLAQSDRFGYDA